MRHIFELYNSGPDLPDDPFHPFTPEEWEQHTPTQMRTYLIQHLPYHLGPNLVPFWSIISSRPTGYSTAAMSWSWAFSRCSRSWLYEISSSTLPFPISKIKLMFSILWPLSWSIISTTCLVTLALCLSLFSSGGS